MRMLQYECVGVPCVWVDHKNGFQIGVVGFCTVLTYLSRRNCTYPLCPEDAIYVDEQLQKLGFLCRNDPPSQDEARTCLQTQEELLQYRDWLALDGICVADLAWAAAIEWLNEHNLCDVALYPNISTWMNKIL